MNICAFVGVGVGVGVGVARCNDKETFYMFRHSYAILRESFRSKDLH